MCATADKGAPNRDGVPPDESASESAMVAAVAASRTPVSASIAATR